MHKPDFLSLYECLSEQEKFSPSFKRHVEAGLEDKLEGSNGSIGSSGNVFHK